MYLKDNIAENVINNCIRNMNFYQNFEEQIPLFGPSNIDYLLGPEFQEICTIKNLVEAFHEAFPLNYVSKSHIKIVEKMPRKYLNINSKLEVSQENQLIQNLQNYHDAFT
jgi:hypothetical protein